MWNHENVTNNLNVEFLLPMNKCQIKGWALKKKNHGGFIMLQEKEKKHFTHPKGDYFWNIGFVVK